MGNWRIVTILFVQNNLFQCLRKLTVTTCSYSSSGTSRDTMMKATSKTTVGYTCLDNFNIGRSQSVKLKLFFNFMLKSHDIHDNMREGYTLVKFGSDVNSVSLV